jgi:head-tail adaptor
MSLKITPGRLTDVINIKTTSDDTDDYGNPLPPVTLFKTRGEVDVKSGDELTGYGSSLTSEIISVLMYQDSRIMNDMILGWLERDYDVKHIKPIRHERSMIVTAEIRTDGGYN